MNSKTGLTIGPIRDARVLAAVHAETVGFAYSEFFPKGSSPPTATELESMWEERLADPSATALAANKGGSVLGTVAVRRDPDFVGEGQLTGLHVLPAVWGQGVGTALHDAAVLLLTSRAFEGRGTLGHSCQREGTPHVRGARLEPETGCRDGLSGRTRTAVCEAPP